MKKLTLLAFIASSAFGYAQVGINTPTPQKTLHVNGAVQLTNELSVGGNAKTAGSAGTAGQILSSNGPGAAPMWISGNALKSAVLGTLNNSSVTVTSNKLIGHSIKLTTGRWLIYVGELLESTDASSSTDNMWTRLTISSSNSAISTTGFTLLGSKLVSGWLAPSIASIGAYSMLTGVIPINVTSPSVDIYLWIANCDVVGTPPATKVGNNGENYFFAVPAN
ncbi:hypothetical protein SAMN05880574_1136 [Chryseobacterium sp. RU37D]|uniref:hypothetical protein n=1 Tax=Chryseobacterium sp. RU37D TaxID=1907397 RepID=UPI000953A721|nr:hypothetical protein [Chryseobacterium sp. RU37D]SIQ43878.1 hypothetical protein SAMN05880574_1136 [Chryseobacterium sp. RU37D]